MELSLLDKLSGTLANAATVTLGTGLGLLLQGRLPERMARIMVQGWDSPPFLSGSPWPTPWGKPRAEP